MATPLLLPIPGDEVFMAFVGHALSFLPLTFVQSTSIHMAGGVVASLHALASLAAAPRYIPLLLLRQGHERRTNFFLDRSAPTDLPMRQLCDALRPSRRRSGQFAWKENEVALLLVTSVSLIGALPTALSLLANLSCRSLR